MPLIYEPNQRMNRLTLNNLGDLIDFNNIYQMKKVTVIAFAFLLLAASVSSCKTHETCPAYGATDTTVTAEPKA